MLIGYARTSTADQQAGYDAQLRDLTEAGCEQIFGERLSSIAERPQLAACLAYARPGDAIVVTRLDRLARSISDLIEIVTRLERRCIGLRILSLARIMHRGWRV
jgi:DNA invertase Pin-like site-specific DNA recombinase